MSKLLSQISFLEMLPSSISGDATIAAAAQALDAQLASVNDLTAAVLLWSALDSITEPLISALAWQLHVDYWPDDFTLTQKRNAVRRSLIRHMRKGTPAAVEEAALEVLTNAIVREWFEYEGERGHYQIETTDDLEDSDTFFKKLLPAVAAAKNARSWLDYIHVLRDLSGNLDMKMLVAQREQQITIGVRFAMDGSIRPQAAVVPMMAKYLTIGVRE